MLKTIIILLMFSKVSVSSLVGRCNECFADSKVACVNRTHFSICYQGTPIATFTKCPDNRFCTDDVHICHSAVEGYTPICYNSNCGDCEITNGVFACLDQTTYGYCFGGKTAQKHTFRSCPHGYVCNYDSQNICVPEEENEPSCGIRKSNTTDSSIMPTKTTIDGTTLTITTTIKDQTNATTKMTTETTTTTQEIAPSTETTTQDTALTTETTTQKTTSTSIPETTTEMITSTSTKNEPRDANTICRSNAKTGYFKSDDLTCHQYVFCYYLSGQYLGWFYNCEFYFNGVTNMCQIERPHDCVAY